MNSLIKHILILFILLGCIGNIHAQRVHYVGPFLNKGEERNSLSTKVENGNILFVKADIFTKSTTVYKYNGTFWVNSLKQELLSNPSNLVVLDKNGMEEVFVVNQTIDNSAIHIWDGKKWKKENCAYAPVKDADSTILLVKHQDKVYFFGSAFNRIGSSSNNGAAYYENGAWKAVGTNYPKLVKMAVSAKDTLYVYGSNEITKKDQIYKFTNDVLIDSIPNADLIISSGSNFLIRQNGAFLLRQGNVFINYSDSLTKYGVQEVYDLDEYNGRIVVHGRGSAGAVIFNFENKQFLKLPATFQGRLHCTKHGDFLSPATDGFGQSYQLGKIEWNSGEIKGQVYLDNNKDCSFGNNDINLRDYIVSFDTFHTTTDGEGNFSLIVPAGLVDSLIISPPKHYTASCKSSALIKIVKDDIVFHDFAFQPDSVIEDLRVTLGAGIAREGHRVYYNVKVKNIGSSKSDIKKLTIEHDKRLSDFQSSENHTIQDNIVRFTVPPLSIQGEYLLNYSLYVNETDLDMGDTLFGCAHLEADQDTLNNKDTLHKVVIAAFDPNRKECFPDGAVTKAVDLIKYTIRFQNTGTDTAFKVIVVDTLERKFPMDKAVVLNTSHPFHYKLLPPQGNTLTWFFDNIMLPDSTTNFKESQGYITFQIKLKKELEIGDSVRNRAHIYFDYQKPVTTNYAVVMRRENIVEPIDTLKGPHNIIVFPNPTTSSIKVNNKRTEDIHFKLYDICGKLIHEEKIEAGRVNQIDLRQISQGMYIMRFEDGFIGKLVKTE